MNSYYDEVKYLKSQKAVFGIIKSIKVLGHPCGRHVRIRYYRGNIRTIKEALIRMNKILN
jgi:hypothetical protein